MVGVVFSAKASSAIPLLIEASPFLSLRQVRQDVVASVEDPTVPCKWVNRRSCAACMMTGTDMESVTIEQALVFYQQHLVLDQQKHKSHFPRSGKSAAIPDDVSRARTFEHQLQTIATILESLKRNPNPLLGDVLLPRPTISPLPPLSKWNDFVFDLGEKRKLDQDDVIHVPLSTQKELSSSISVTLSP
jgi:hypothetical protein